MKYMLLVALVISMFGCSVMQYPQNAQKCHNDGECRNGEYCGFVAVDTAPVCREYHPAIHWYN
jgi:hypothetical protein